jgi:hypothetical protein
MILMDYSDIFLPVSCSRISHLLVFDWNRQLAKMFRYLAFSWLCDATFVWFLLSWFVTRHVLFVIVIKSIYADLPKLPNFGVSPGQGRYLDYRNWVAFVTMLSALQVLCDVWLLRFGFYLTLFPRCFKLFGLAWSAEWPGASSAAEVLLTNEVTTKGKLAERSNSQWLMLDFFSDSGERDRKSE